MASLCLSYVSLREWLVQSSHVEEYTLVNHRAFLGILRIQRFRLLIGEGVGQILNNGTTLRQGQPIMDQSRDGVLWIYLKQNKELSHFVSLRQMTLLMLSVKNVPWWIPVSFALRWRGPQFSSSRQLRRPPQPYELRKGKSVSLNYRIQSLNQEWRFS